MGLLDLFSKKTSTNTSNTTNATQTNIAVGDQGMLVGDNSYVTNIRDESVQMFDSRDQSQTLNDSRDQSMTIIDQSQRYDVSGDIVKDALSFASRNDALNADLWSQAITESYQYGMQYAEMTGEAYKAANDSIVSMANGAIGSVTAANASDGEALAASLEKFGKMGVILILGVAIVGAMRAQ